ncbi:MAG: TIGR00341 family protein [Bdellovibrionaceae bacterium]|nr:TIGR00341 family protein [Pseudobdellovibrionaceae bacterium]
MEKTSAFFDKIGTFGRLLRRLFDLRSDMDEEGTVESIRANVSFKSANAWTLIFAIFIASVGLNVNSTAVIIGAMLISPLMGPIVGMGLGLGIYDYELIKTSLRNLGYAVAISLVTSALYFLITPLSEVQSELLARTQPTFFDVMIAFFGGAAGIVASSRRQRGNAVPGVAIATALMPPLCTAGFGIATGNVSYLAGALYLFVINCVFICVSTFIFVRYLRFAPVKFANQEEETKVNRWVLGISMAVVIPSLIFAWFLQLETVFQSRARDFVEREAVFEKSFIVGKDLRYDWKTPRIQLHLVGEPLTDAQVQSLKDRLRFYKIENTNLDIKQLNAGPNEQEVRSRSSLAFDSQLTKQLQAQLASVEQNVRDLQIGPEWSGHVTSELKALFPRLEQVQIQNPAKEDGKALVVWLSSPSVADRSRVNEFLKKRLPELKAAVTHVRRL